MIMSHLAGTPNSLSKQGVTQEPTPDLASCLAFLHEQEPDLAALIEAWPTLPDAIKAGIQAMVRAAQDRGG